MTDDQGTLTSQQRYLPFGGIRTNVTTPNSPNTDYGYTGQRNLDEDLGLMDYKARFYSPVLNRFIQPDSIVPDPTNPQAWNRFSYVVNSPINFNDPTGHAPSCDDWDGCKSGVKGVLKPSTPTPTLTTTYTPTLTSTPTPTRTTTASNTPVPTPVDPILEDAIKLIQLSDIGGPLYEWGMNNGFTIDYNKECKGNLLNNTEIYLNPCRPSAVYAAGQIGHEIMHYMLFQGHTGSQLEEYLAFMTGDAIRAELISEGHGTGTSYDISIPLTEYTVQLENNPNLATDLTTWFDDRGLDIYYLSPNEINGTPTGWGVPPLPLTFTPNP